MLAAITEIAAQYHDFCTEGFSESQHLQWLVTEMEKLRMPELTHLLDSLRQPDSIIALPIKVDPKFTLFFVVVPAGGSFGWHSHPRMNGLSKCLHGELVVSTLDLHHLQPEGGRLLYPKNQLRKEHIRGWGNSVSTIEPHNYNIHRIDAPVLAAFFDLLMPDYP
jgi:quercetin dioxygenase-like cupin family protein